MEQESMTHTPEKKQAAEAACERQDLDLTERDFKITAINMSTELKESVIIEVKEGMTTVLHCIEDISEEIKMVKKGVNGSLGV